MSLGQDISKDKEALKAESKHIASGLTVFGVQAIMQRNRSHQAFSPGLPNFQLSVKHSNADNILSPSYSQPDVGLM